MKEYFKDRFIDELNSDGHVEIAGLVWTRHDVLETMDPDAAAQVFEGWIDQTKQAAVERVRESLHKTGCLDRFRTLRNRFRGSNIIPFVGAGMSRSSGLPLWPDFLVSAVQDEPAHQAEVQALVDENKYEEAAERLIVLRGPDFLSETIHNTFGSHHVRAVGPVTLLPHLFDGEVITTNFDYILRNVYEAAGSPFRQSLSGPELATAPQRIGNAPHCLLRLHGEADSDVSRVLTRTEYDAAYSQGRTLHGVLGALAGTRSFLFLGCSLSQDRTLAALGDLKAAAAAAPPRHYAFLPEPSPEKREARRQQLADAGVFPIYYDDPDHDQSLEDLILALGADDV